MPIVLLTDKERKFLLELLEMHCDGLDVAKDRIIEIEEGDNLLPMTAAVDEAVVTATTLMRRLKDAV